MISFIFTLTLIYLMIGVILATILLVVCTLVPTGHSAKEILICAILMIFLWFPVVIRKVRNP